MVYSLEEVDMNRRESLFLIGLAIAGPLLLSGFVGAAPGKEASVTLVVSGMT